MRNQSLSAQIEIKAALRREFIQRSRRNPAYSLRAFAKYLGIDQSFLSKILKGQRTVTPELARSLAPRLGLKSQSLNSRNQADAPSEFLNLQDDEFELISEWRHFALLELAKTKGFKLDPLRMAKRLGLHITEVQEALERLERLGFVKVTKGKLKVIAANTSWTNTARSSEGRRILQRSLIEKSLDAIDHVPFEFRENGSLTVAVSKSRLPEFKEKLRSVRRELAAFFQEEGAKDLDEVYQFTVALFPLTVESKEDGRYE